MHQLFLNKTPGFEEAGGFLLFRSAFYMPAGVSISIPVKSFALKSYFTFLLTTLRQWGHKQGFFSLLTSTPERFNSRLPLHKQVAGLRQSKPWPQLHMIFFTWYFLSSRLIRIAL
jgi:hypothetical protein